MFTRDDLIDAVLRRLGAQAPARVGARGGKSAPARKGLPEVPGRRFLTEREVRNALTPGAREITIPKGAIVSPLALEWLVLKGIEVRRS